MWERLRLAVVISGLAVAWMLWGCGKKEDPASRKLNLLLITLDTCRADYLGCYGRAVAHTPRIDALAAEGIRCSDVATTAPITLPAHASILTGLYPCAHGVRDNGEYTLDDRAVTLAERLKEVGYETQAFISAKVLDRRYNLTQGFDGYDDNLWNARRKALHAFPERSADATAERVVDWLERREKQGATRPFFSWVHFFDPHVPYNAQISGLHPEATPYDAEVAVADRGVGRIIDALKDRGVIDDTLVVVTSDHGESLGEHQEETHGVFVYQATIAVPLIFRCPQLFPQARTYDGPVRVVDIMPTILSVLGVAGKDGNHTQGTDLSAALRGEASPPLQVQYMESLLSESGFGMAPLFGVSFDGYKWIAAPKPELYDLKKDPRELNNLYPAMADRWEQLNVELDEIIASSQRYALDAGSGSMTKETTELLYSLGYLAPPDQRKSMGGIDPKEGIVLFNRMKLAADHVARGEWKIAEKVLGEVLQAMPENVSAHNLLAHAKRVQGKYEEAKRACLASLAVQPRQVTTLALLGDLCSHRDDLPAADQWYRKALAITPRSVGLMTKLGSVEGQRGHPEKARKWYEKAIRVDDKYPTVYLGYGDLCFQNRDYLQALRLYEKLLTLTPGSFEATYRAGSAAMYTEYQDRVVGYLKRAEAIDPTSWLPSYYLACHEALQGNPQAALRTLWRAVEKGLADPKRLESEENFASVRTLPGYADLLQRMTSHPDGNKR